MPRIPEYDPFALWRISYPSQESPAEPPPSQAGMRMLDDYLDGAAGMMTGAETQFLPATPEVMREQLSNMEIAATANETGWVRVYPGEDCVLVYETQAEKVPFDRDMVRHRLKCNLSPAPYLGWLQRMHWLHANPVSQPHLGPYFLAVAPHYDQHDREAIVKYIWARKAFGEGVKNLYLCTNVREAYDLVENLFDYAREISGPGGTQYFNALILNMLKQAAKKNSCAYEFYERTSHRPTTYKDGRVYTPPWKDEMWWTEHVASLVHCIFPSKQHPGYLAYRPTFRHFAAGNAVAIRPGRYLTKYFGKGTRANLSDPDIRRWGAEFVNLINGRVLHRTDLTTKENQDEVADAWYRIYRNGPGSCMKGSSSVRIYAYPDNSLRLAYFTRDDQPDSEPIARCVVRDDKMQWLRIYPDDGSGLWQDMKAKLSAAGYAHGHLDGVKIQHKKNGDDIICPYIDCGSGGTQGVDVARGYLLCGGSEWDATTTHGLLTNEDEDEDMVVCEACEDRIPADDSCHAGDDGPYCDSCFREHFVHAHRRRGMEYCSRDDAIYCESDGGWYFPDATVPHGVFECALTNDYYLEADLKRVSDDRYVHCDSAVKLDVSDSEGYDYAYPGEEVTTTDGRVILAEEAVRIVPKTKTHILHRDDDPGEFFPSLKLEVEKETV